MLRTSVAVEREDLERRERTQDPAQRIDRQPRLGGELRDRPVAVCHQIGDPGAGDDADRLRDHEAVGVLEQLGARRRSRHEHELPELAAAPRTPRRPPPRRSSGNVAWTGTATRPAASSGSTASRRRSTTSAFSSADRERSVEPRMRARLCITRPKSISARAPAPVPITASRPCGASRSTSAVRFSPPTSSRITSYSPSTSVAAPSAATRSRLLRAVPVTSAPSGDAELHRRRADAAGRAVDEQPLARQQQRLREERVVRGRVRLHEPARLRPVDAVGHRQRVPRVDDDELGVAAAAEERHHPLAGADDLAGALEPGDVDRRARRRRVVAGALHQVGVVDPGRAHADQQLAVARHGIGPLLDLEPCRPG